jgi:hypothetical protein
MSRRKFIPIAYRFFIANLILFYVLMRTLSPVQQPWVGRVFYVWVSVFNLFVVTVFWAFMTDIFNFDQGKRLFGFISVGGTLGGILGGTITASLDVEDNPSKFNSMSDANDVNRIVSQRWLPQLDRATTPRFCVERATQAALASSKSIICRERHACRRDDLRS